MKRLIVVMIMLLSAAAPAQTTAPTTRPFVVYDNLFSYTGKPDTTALGWRQGLTTGALLTADRSGPDETLCRQFGRDAAALGAGTLAVIDIEHWPTDLRKHTAAQVAESVAKLRQATAWAREGAGSTPILIGHYTVGVIRNYHGPLRNEPGEMSRWRLANDKIAEALVGCDVICPSLYAMPDSDTTSGNWVKYAIANIAEARRVGGGRPVVPFVWWRWHGTNPTLGERYMDSTDWRVVLDTVRQHADGMIVWDSALFNDRYDANGRRMARRAWPQPGWALWRTTVEWSAEALTGMQ